MVYVIVLIFLVSAYATVVSPPRTAVSKDVRDSAVSYEDLEVSGASSTLPVPQAHWDMSTLRNDKVQNLADPTGATDGTKFYTAPGEGLVGGALDFNGNNAAVECADPNNLLKSDSGTVSTWIKSTGKPPETTQLRVALVILENGENATEQDRYLLGLLGTEVEEIYSGMVHGHGSLNVSTTIYEQTPVNLEIKYPHMLEVNNFIRLGNPDIYDFICFYPKANCYWPQGMMNFKNTIQGIGRPYLWYDDLANTTTVNDTEPISKYITAAAVLNAYLPENEGEVARSAYILVHELSHAYCGWWNYTVGDTTYFRPGDTYHYSGKLRTDLHSALGGYGWRDNHDGTWTVMASLDPGLGSIGDFDDTEYNMDEYSIGLIPASEVVPIHQLVPDAEAVFYLPGWTRTATDSQITIDQILATDGQWWNKEDRQCVMLRCTNEYGDVFRGQGWGLFVGTVAPNDHVYWYSGSADGAVEWRYGTAHVCDGAWHQIAVSWSGTTGMLYVDGVLDIQWTIHPVSAADNVHTVIGCEDPTNPYFESWFSGSVDEVYMFNSVLNDAQIAELYAQAPVYNVNTGLVYSGIQEAIDAPETSAGHTLLVRPGTHESGVNVWKPVVIRGESRSETIINGGGSGTAFSVTVGGVTIESLTITGVTVGVNAPELSGCTFRNLTIRNIATYAIAVSGTDNSLIRDNLMEGNGVWGTYGVYCSDSTPTTASQNKVINNTIRSCTEGLGMFKATGCLITDNTIRDNTYGIYTGAQFASNTLYHNNIMTNFVQVYLVSPSSVNTWDNGYPSGGNYWSTYTGVDVKKGASQSQKGSDGIGDTPLILDTNNRDRYPLMKPWHLPTAPQSLTATAGNTQVTLTWTAPASTGGYSVTGYVIYRGTASGQETYLAPCSGLTYIDQGLTNGVTYYYKVSARNVMGEGLLSGEVSATPASGPAPPGAPRSLTATPSSRAITLNWLAPADGGPVTTYEIWRGTASGGEIPYASVSGIKLTYKDTGANAGITYYYQVRAVNSGGPSPFSNEVSCSR